MARFTGRRAALTITGLLGPLGPQATAQQPNSAETGSITGEYYRSQDSDRDIDVLTVGADRAVNLRSWLKPRGAVSLVVTTGTRSLQDETPAASLEANSLGFRFLGSLRLSPIRVGRLRPFVELGLGMLFTSEQFPPGGTWWNLTQRWGAGAAVRVGTATGLLVGVFRTHVSNGKGFGHPRNPAYDGIGVLIGVYR